MIAVYADETGTGGIPKSGKEPAPGICGFLATTEMWERFRLDWKSALNDHTAPYFHFRELDPSQRSNKECKFFGWDNNRTDDFIYGMATVASSGPIPFGGNVSVKMEHGNTPTKKTYTRATERHLRCFFKILATKWTNSFQMKLERFRFSLTKTAVKNGFQFWIAR